MSFDGMRITAATVIHAAQITDRYGNTTYDWTDVTEEDVMIWEGPSPQTGRPSVGAGIELRDIEIEVKHIFLEPTVDIDKHDRIRFSGRTHFLVDMPLHAKTPRGVHHIECTVKSVDG